MLGRPPHKESFEILLNPKASGPFYSPAELSKVTGSFHHLTRYYKAAQQAINHLLPITLIRATFDEVRSQAYRAAMTSYAMMSESGMGLDV